MTVLFELAVQIARIHDRKKDRQAVAEGWGDPEDYDLEPEDVPSRRSRRRRRLRRRDLSADAMSRLTMRAAMVVHPASGLGRAGRIADTVAERLRPRSTTSSRSPRARSRSRAG